MKTNRRISAATLAALLVAGTASAAYFHEAHRADALQLSDWGLKEHFVVTAPVGTAKLTDAEAAEILAAPALPGLFEQEDGGIRLSGRCGEDSPKARPCELKWESGNLAKAKGTVSRIGVALTLKSESGQARVLRDWNKCAPHGECDGERFTYLGRLGRAPYQAVEIGYGHDSPSLVLIQAKSGAMLAVHYGSEPTFLNPAESLLANCEDLNDAASLLVTTLTGDTAALDLQCLGARTPEKSFGVTVKHWASDTALDLVLTENVSGAAPAAEPTKIPVRFERSSNGIWTIKSTLDLAAKGFECRELAK